MKTQITLDEPTPEQIANRELPLRVTCTEVEDCVSQLGQAHVFGAWEDGPSLEGGSSTCRHCEHCPWVEYILNVDIPA